MKSLLMRLVGRAVLLGVLLSLGFAGVSQAATLRVTTTKDSSDKACTAKKCSLRDAITFAQAGDTVVVPASSKPYAVTLGKIKILEPITISGAGPSKSVIKSNGKDRVFEVTATPTSSATVAIKGVTITGGHATAMPGGGAILVDFDTSTVAVNLVLAHSSVTGNSAAVSTGDNVCCGGGGGIYSNGGDVTLERSSVSSNSAMVTGSTASTEPQAGEDGGGGIYDNEGSIYVVASRLTHNSATVNGYYCCHGGGAIYEFGVPPGTVTISSGSKLTDNRFNLKGTQTDISDPSNCCSGGGAVYQDSGSTSISHSTLSGNRASIRSGQCCHGGGAVYMDVGDSNLLTVKRSSINDNTATVKGPTTTSASSDECCSGGGAVATLSAGVQLTKSTLDGNTSNVTAGNCCQGGGAVQLDTGGPSPPDGVTSTDSTISNNRSLISDGTQSGAGAVYEDTGSPSTYTNSTIADNSTNATGAENGGGGLYIFKGITTGSPDVLAAATVAGNSAPGGAGGAILNGSSLLETKGSIVALNSAGHGANCAGFTYMSDPAPVFTSLGYNLTNSRDTCDFTQSGDRVVKKTAVKLGPLANNGGPTQTMAELKGSAAIDHGAPAALCTSASGAVLHTDQRGKPRPDNGEKRCDVGAYEYQDKSTG